MSNRAYCFHMFKKEENMKFICLFSCESGQGEQPARANAFIALISAFRSVPNDAKLLLVMSDISLAFAALYADLSARQGSTVVTAKAFCCIKAKLIAADANTTTKLIPMNRFLDDFI